MIHVSRHPALVPPGGGMCQWGCLQPISCVQNVGHIQSLFSLGVHKDD